MPTRAYARIVSASALTAIACALVALIALPAEAAAYRYWTYWQSPGTQTWEFATQGPGTSVPADGTVEGWSFQVSEESAGGDAAPSALPDFDELCGTTAASPDHKRVGLVVDPGRPEFSPAGEATLAPVATCVSVDVDATGYDVVRSVLDVRTEKGLVCGLGGYPQRECAPLLDDAEVSRIASAAKATPAESDAPSTTESAAVDDGSPVPTLAVTGLIALSVGATLVWARRRGARDA